MARVTATQTGYYGSKRRDAGEEFVLADRAHFSATWMEPVGWSVGGKDPLDHDGDGRKGGSLPKSAPAKAPEPLRASTETIVTPPAEAPKKIDPITGNDI